MARRRAKNHKKASSAKPAAAAAAGPSAASGRVATRRKPKTPVRDQRELHLNHLRESKGTTNSKMPPFKDEHILVSSCCESKCLAGELLTVGLPVKAHRAGLPNHPGTAGIA
jgi:hypothetical protein